MKQLFIAIVVLLVLTLTGRQTVAADFRVVTEEWAPFNYMEGGEPKGFSVELLQAAFKKMGKAPTIEFLPWTRAYRIATSEPNVLIFTISRIPERESLFKWVAPIYPRVMYFYKIRKRNDIQLKSVEDAKRYMIGTPSKSDSATLNLLSLGFNSEKLDMLATGGTDNAKKLAMGRIDLMISSEPHMLHAIKIGNLNPADFVKTIPVLTNQGNYSFAFSMNTPDEAVKSLRQALQKVKEDGTYNKLKRKYFQ
jgi:polar amino acid transport system substrate-binding protein